MRGHETFRRVSRTPTPGGIPSGWRAHERRASEHRKARRLMRGDSRPATRRLVRHLLAGCTGCVEVTRRLWMLGEDALASAGAPASGGACSTRRATAASSSASTSVGASGRRCSDRSGSRLRSCCRLFGLPPAERLAPAGSADRFRTLMLCEALLARARHGGGPLATRPWSRPSSLSRSPSASTPASTASRPSRTSRAAPGTCSGDPPGDRRRCGRGAGARGLRRAARAWRRRAGGARRLATHRARLAPERGHRREAVALLDRGARLLPPGRGPRRLGRRSSSAANAARGGEGEVAAVALREGLALLDERQEPELVARALAALARALSEAGRVARRCSWSSGRTRSSASWATARGCSSCAGGGPGGERARSPRRGRGGLERGPLGLWLRAGGARPRP